MAKACALASDAAWNLCRQMFYDTISGSFADRFRRRWTRDLKLLLACDGRRGLPCCPVHPRFVNVRGRAAYVDNTGMHRAVPRCT